MTPSVQNLNSKLSPPAQRPTGSAAIGVSRRASATQGPAPTVRIGGARSGYRGGGYHLNL